MGLGALRCCYFFAERAHDLSEYSKALIVQIPISLEHGNRKAAQKECSTLVSQLSTLIGAQVVGSAVKFDRCCVANFIGSMLNTFGLFTPSAKVQRDGKQTFDHPLCVAALDRLHRTEAGRAEPYLHAPYSQERNAAGRARFVSCYYFRREVAWLLSCSELPTTHRLDALDSVVKSPEQREYLLSLITVVETGPSGKTAERGAQALRMLLASRRT